jgi:hypothetical protein
VVDAWDSVVAWANQAKPDLTDTERRLWDAYPTGAVVSLGDDRPDGTDDPDRVVRAEVISALLLGAREGVPGRVPAVRLEGARISGTLDVSGGEVGCELRLRSCALDRTPDFSNARARQMRLGDCSMPGFDGGGLRVDGFFSLSGSEISGEVRLIRGYVSGGFRMNAVRVHNPDGYALFAGGLTVDVGLFIRDAEFTGGIRLTGARLTGGMFLERTSVRGVSTPALDCDNVLVEDKMECSAGFTADGVVRLRGARINGTLSFDEGELRASVPEARALHMSHSQVKELILTPRSPIRGGVTLGYSTIDVILDRADIWPDDLRLNGLVYQTLRGEPESKRLDWVGRDPEGFRPQPYEHLAQWLRRIGREDLYRRCQLAKQRARRRQLNPLSRVWGVLLDWTVGYGYRPWISGLWLVLLLVLGTTVFSLHHPHTIRQPDERPHFHAFVYTLDLMLPLETFGQRSAWEPVGWTDWFAWGLTGAGWFLATALIAGVARVLRRT